MVKIIRIIIRTRTTAATKIQQLKVKTYQNSKKNNSLSNINNNNNNSNGNNHNKNKYKDDTHYIGMIPQIVLVKLVIKFDDKLLRLSDAAFDLGADEKQFDAKRQVQHWDRKKKKYIKLGINEIDETGRRTNKSRNSGYR